MQALMESALCNDYTFFFLFLGCLLLFSMCVATFAAVIPRERFARQVKHLTDTENPLAFISTDIAKFTHSFQRKLPRCGVVMPVKGVHNQSYANWRTQITSLYGGPLEFYFCIESEDDPAHPHILRLQRENPEFRIHLMVAGVNWHCSQKIHNQMHGFEKAMYSCDYVIVLDDDLKLHPGTIRAWVEEFESDPRVLAASGYAFEYVGPGVQGITPYFAMLWRCIASNGFNEPNDRPANVWGGAMMFRASELRANIYGITDAWRDGGYSEDWITLTMARYHNRTLAVPKSAIFPNELGEIQFSRFWNFLCRQVFVLTNTYATKYQQFIAWGAGGVNATMHALIFLAGCLASILTPFLLYTTISSKLSSAATPAAAEGPFASLGVDGACASSGAVPSALAFWVLLLLMGCVIKAMLVSFAKLCNVLSPHGYDNEPIDCAHVPILKISLAYFLYASLIPAATLATLTATSIVWSGVNFHVKDGRVSKMERMDGKGDKPKGEWYSVSRERSLEVCLRQVGEMRLRQQGI